MQQQQPQEEQPARRRGRPRKEAKVESNVEAEVAQTIEPAQPVARRRRTKKNEDVKELFPFYEQSLF